MIALVFGVALVCAMDLANRAVLRAFVEVIDTMAGRAALQVTAGGAPFAEDVSERLASVPGVEMAVPVVSATAFTGDGSGELMTVHGVDVTSDSVMRAYEARDGGGMALEDPLLFLNEPDSIVVTRSFASRRGLHPTTPRLPTEDAEPRWPDACTGRVRRNLIAMDLRC